MERVEAVIFDLGRVLVDLDVTRGIFRDLAASAGGDLPSLLADPVFRRFSTGAIGPEEFHRALAARLGTSLSFEDFCVSWCAIFLPMEGMEELFAEVAARVPVGLLSDTDPVHWAFELERVPMLRRIPRPTLSFEVGAMKPDPAVYLAAARSVGRPPAACLFVDDLARNVEGAHRVGMQATVFRGPAALREELVARGVLG